ncbi:hypothetical protein C3007_01475 [Avibacterium gallinarum]|uniref:Uncharacterized conserved protein n=1 Tax=Avibacterium gallinarum TaxID=755 RepID=A0A379AVJ4_AVIGA|nr:DUF262 domain-containing protein [Avibacterium gallinarum]POY45246.1 hypothetical protein C3007_01475 [Avibacterium gallinarum]TDP27773.1 uncharacterized protein DUF262 [Avibacterium gallinarum]SUB26011.1 Uncharacterized conserved protein [Avibacterium gallinarum]
MNTKHLNLFPIDYPFETLISRVKEGKLKLDPDFQRKYKWDKPRGWKRASKFIESCLMRIPLPSCYFAEDSQSNHLVIDGVQRLTTIQKFFNDEFALEGMTAFSELEGKRFSELGELKSDLETTTIRCIVLRKDNPQELIREIFARLNQGSVILTDQEIRHALYPSKFNELLDELSSELESYKFNHIKDESGKSELVLRFFALATADLSGYSDRLKEYLDTYLSSKKDVSEELIEEFRDKFHTALSNCKKVFGDDVFLNLARKKNMKLKTIVHYELQMYSIGQLSPEIVEKYAIEIRKKYEELCNNDDFLRTLSRSSQTRSSIMKRRRLWENLLSTVINE